MPLPDDKKLPGWETEFLAESAKANPTLITGCRLVIQGEGKSLWGDLWMVGETFVFNGMTDAQGQTRWQYGLEHARSPAGTDCKITFLMTGAHYFDRRGVVVFEALHATFNPLAREHIKELLDATTS